MAKVAVVGGGYWGSKVCRAAISRFGMHEVALVESDPLTRSRIARLFPGLKAVATLAELHLEESATLTTVVVATPVASHESVALEAISLGLNVLIEKPVAHSSEAVAKIAHAAEEHGVKVGVGHTFLFSNRVQRLREEVTSSTFGDIKYLSSRRLNLGIHRSDVDVLWDLGPHDLSIALFLLQESPTWVQAAGQFGLKGLVETCFLTLGFPNEVLASVSLSWRAPNKTRDLLVVGTHQMAIYNDGDDDQPVRIIDSGLTIDEGADYAVNSMTYRFGETRSPAITAAEPLQVELGEFQEYVDGPREDFRSPLAMGADIVRVLEACSESMRSGGRRVDIGAK